MDSNNKPKLHFKTNALIKNIVGKDLINDDNIAIIELVKNAYDAQSPIVEIVFESIKKGVNSNNSRILIADSGHGMSYNDIVNKWLNIAYSEKKDNSDRTFAGSKGVGRFSCDRLGELLDLYTWKNVDDIAHVSIDWRSFEINERDTEIQSIPVSYSKTSSIELANAIGNGFGKSGTVLVISSLRSEWDQAKLESLRRSLERFVNPNQEFDKQAFRVFLRCPEYIQLEKSNNKIKINGEITNQIFKSLDFKTSYIESSIDQNGEFITTALWHKGNKLFTLVETNHYLCLRDIKIVIYYLNQYQKAYFKKQTGHHSVNFGSIFLFLNSFRVPPYGDYGDDWLGIERRKGQGHSRYLGTRELLGRIEINDKYSDDNSEWNVISSREGIVQGSAYKELVDSSSGYFYKILKKLEKYIVKGLDWDSLKVPDRRVEKIVLDDPYWDVSREEYKETENEKDRRVAEIIHSIISISTDINSIVSIDFDEQIIKMLEKQNEEELNRLFEGFDEIDPRLIERGNLSRRLKDLKKAIDIHKDKYGKQKQLVSVLESDNKKLELKYRDAEKKAATLKRKAQAKEEENLFLKAVSSQDLEDVINMHHHIIISSDIVKKRTSMMIKLLRRDEDISKDQLIGLLESVSFENQKILRLSNFATKRNFKIATAVIERDLLEFIDTYVRELSDVSTYSRIKIKYDNKNNVSYNCSFKPIEITILIDNLLDNAKKAKSSQFKISTSNNGKGLLKIKFSDDGKGIDRSIENKKDIFNKGFTTTKGSGLGLHHVVGIVNKMNGDIAVVEPELNGTSIEIGFKS